MTKLWGDLLKEAAWDYAAIEVMGDMGLPADDYKPVIRDFRAGAEWARRTWVKHLIKSMSDYVDYVENGGVDDG